MKIRILLFLLTLSLLVCTACGKKTTVRSTPQGPAVPSQPTEPGLFKRADRAWQSRDYGESQRIYGLLSKDPTLSDRRAPVVWQRLTESALANRDTSQARRALASWADVPTGVDKSWPWIRAKAALLRLEQDDKAATPFLTSVLDNDNIPKDVRAKAAKALVAQYKRENNLPGLLHAYGTLYHLTASSEIQGDLEAELNAILREHPLAQLSKALGTVREDPNNAFPKNILTGVYDIKRLEADPELWPEVWHGLRLLGTRGLWNGPYPFADDLEKFTARFGQPRKHIALIIPLQGPYGTIGWQIARGVGAGQWLLGGRGMDLDVTIINSSAPGWEKELTGLATTCDIVGGPLQKSTWQKIRDLSLVDGRTFFVFMPTVEDEGTRAWRFFGSPRDQVRAMVQSAFACQVSRFAVLYPNEPYGRRMAQYFWEEATAQGGRVTGLADYPPKQPSQWGKTVATLLRAQDLNEDELNPEPDFKAVFLPDSLKGARLIVPQFYFYDENRLMFLGPQLWGQGKNPDSPLEENYFRLSVYPGAWWADNPGSGVQTLQNVLEQSGQKGADFWVALGFDFIRFAAGLGCTSGVARQGLNETLSGPQSLDWAMAPLEWDSQGRASQDYFIFQPTREGPRIALQEQISHIMDVRENRRQQRIVSLNATAESDTGETNGTNATRTEPVTPSDSGQSGYRHKVIRSGPSD
ncbi:penicillin-binding protein activator [Desulfoplanes sp.]